MKKLILTVLTVVLSISIFAQTELTQDPKAKKVLDNVSKITKAYKTVQIKFSYTIENKQEKVSETNSGYVYLKGNKYKLIIPGTEIFSDGKTVWSYIKDAEEIDITDPGDDESIFNPATLFTIYQKGFKYQHLGTQKVNNVVADVIDLFPDKPGEKPYSRVRLTVDNKKGQILSVKTFGKNGIDYIVNVKEYKPNIKISDGLFVFNKSKYPANVEVVDMR